MGSDVRAVHAVDSVSRNNLAGIDNHVAGLGLAAKRPGTESGRNKPFVSQHGDTMDVPLTRLGADSVQRRVCLGRHALRHAFRRGGSIQTHALLRHFGNCRH